jgi:hypothetical protein
MGVAMGKLFRSASIFLFVIAVCASSAQAQQWVWVRSNNYTIITDASEADGRQVALRLEEMRTAYSAIFHRQDRMSTPATAVVFATKNADSVASLGRDLKAAAVGEPRVYRGVERWFLNGIQLAASGSLVEGAHNDAALRQVALMLLDNNYPRTPAWFDAGLAEYLAALQVEKENLVLGRVPARSGATPDIPLERLLETNGAPAGEQAAFRRKAWLVVHWILTNGRLPDAGRYFDLVVNKGAGPREACLRAFSMSPEEWDKELAAYDPAKNERRFPLPYVDPVRFLARKITVAEAKTAVADMALDSAGDEKAAMDSLYGTMQQFPTIAAVHRALAYGYLRRHDLNNSMEHVHRAMELSNTDAMMHYLQAIILNNGNAETIDVESADVRLSPALTNAIKMDPQFARAYVMRGLARLAADRNDLALSDLRIACGLRPRDERALLALAQAKAATGDSQNATALLGLLSKSNDAVIAQSAKDAMADTGRQQREKKRLEAQGYGGYRDQTDPRWKVPNAENGEAEKKEEAPDMRKTEYMKGTLVDVQCSDSGSATMSVSSGGRAWKLQIADRKSVLLMNRESFSCAWKNVKVGVNYKAGAGQAGDVVSIELLE